MKTDFQTRLPYFPMRGRLLWPAVWAFLFSCWLNTGWAQTSKGIPSAPVATESKMTRFETQSTPADAGRAKVILKILESGSTEPVMGATAVLHRLEASKYYGQLSNPDGESKFDVLAGPYSLRIQLTGLATFEDQTLQLESGKTYLIEVMMGKTLSQQGAPPK